MADNYTISIIATTPNYIRKTATFYLRVQELTVSSLVSTTHSAPFFVSELVNMVNVSLMCSKIYQLPQFKDSNPIGSVKITFSSNTNKKGLPVFIQYNVKNKLVFSPINTSDVAIHIVNIKLTNLIGDYQNYTLYVQVLPPN